MKELLLFYTFSGLAVVSASMVVTVKNPVHSVLFLILTFISSTAILFLVEVEFISLIFIIVYVGAIAVLFLFVVMMLDIKITDLNKSFFKYFPVGSLLGVAFFLEVLIILTDILERNPYYSEAYLYMDWVEKLDFLTNIGTLGQVLYTSLFTYFLIAGIILLVAMLGAVALTLTFARQSKIQLISKQVSRNFFNSVILANEC